MIEEILLTILIVLAAYTGYRHSESEDSYP